MPYLRFEIKCLFSYVSERTSFSRTMLRLFPADKIYSQFESYESYKIESIVKWLAASLLVCVTLMTIKTTSRTTQLKTCFLTNLAGSGHICPSHFMTNVPFRLMKFRLYSESQLYSRISGIKTTILQVWNYLHQNTNMIFISIAINTSQAKPWPSFSFLVPKILWLFRSQMYHFF